MPQSPPSSLPLPTPPDWNDRAACSQTLCPGSGGGGGYSELYLSSSPHDTAQSEKLFPLWFTAKSAFCFPVWGCWHQIYLVKEKKLLTSSFFYPSLWKSPLKMTSLLGSKPQEAQNNTAQTKAGLAWKKSQRGQNFTLFQWSSPPVSKSHFRSPFPALPCPLSVSRKNLTNSFSHIL